MAGGGGELGMASGCGGWFLITEGDDDDDDDDDDDELCTDCDG